MSLLDLINSDSKPSPMSREEFKARLVPQEIKDMLAARKEKVPLIIEQDKSKTLENLLEKDGQNYENNEISGIDNNDSDDFIKTLMDRLAQAQQKKKEDRIKKIVKLLLN